MSSLESSMSNPRVSVLMPAFRRSDTIVKAVESALDQTWRDLEVVVVDDGSGDGTLDALSVIDDPRLRVFSHETNQGGNAARRTALDESRGELLAFLDADDVWLPTKIEKQVASLEAAGPTAGLSYTWYDLHYPDGRREPGRRPRTEGGNLDELLQSNFVGTFSCVMVRREVIDHVGVPDPSLRACQDWEFYIRVNAEHSIVCVPEVLVHYRRDDGDEHRISASAERVCAGHREVYRRVADRLDAMPPQEGNKGRRYFMETFANHADVRAVATVAADTRALTLDDVRFITHMVARATRKSAAAIVERRTAPRAS